MTGALPEEYPHPRPPQEDLPRQQAPSPALLEMDQLRNQVSQLQAHLEDSLNGIMSQLRYLGLPLSRSNSPYDDRSHGPRFAADGPMYDQGYPDLQPTRQVTFQQMGTPQNMGYPPSYPVPQSSVPSPQYTSTRAPSGPMAPLDLSVRATPRWPSPSPPPTNQMSYQGQGTLLTNTVYPPCPTPMAIRLPLTPTTMKPLQLRKPLEYILEPSTLQLFPPALPLVKKIPTYNGLTQWEPFIQQFEQIAEPETIAYLPLKHSTYLSDCTDYAAIMSRLR